MNIQRMSAIAAIYLLACVGWLALGTATQYRSTEYAGRLGAEVQQLWGVPLVQTAPSLSVEIPGADRARALMPASSDIKVALDTDYRKKGLIWYPTYACQFDGAYAISNPEEVTQKVRIHFAFPAKNGTYDGFSVMMDGKPILSPINIAEGVNELVEVAPQQTVKFHVAYKTRGISEWRYRLDSSTGRTQNLQMTVNTNFQAVDYPEGCLSPAAATLAEGGMKLQWTAADLISREDIGLLMPEKLNPGPLITRITFFAPVCLIFFFVLVSAINILYKVNIHPMHYLFVAAGFFAFHLLLSYMAGLVNIHLAFTIASVVSVFLVTGYLSAALRGRLPWKVAAAAQVFFLVLFSYSFFLQGITGLTIAVGSVVTLAVLMKLTAGVDWETTFAKPPRTSVIAPTPPIPPIPGDACGNTGHL